MTNSPCLGCKQVMHYTFFKAMEDEENGICQECYSEEIEDYLAENIGKDWEDKFLKWLSAKYKKNFTEQ